MSNPNQNLIAPHLRAKDKAHNPYEVLRLDCVLPIAGRQVIFNTLFFEYP